MIRLGLAVVAGVAWMVTLPITAAALLNTEQSWATIAFIPSALLSAGLWWVHMKEREWRIGLAGVMAGWLFMGSLALLDVSGFFWVLVAMALVASTIAYGVVLLVTQSHAATPRLDLVTGLLLFATAGATAIFTITTGLPQTESWWMPAHWILGIGLGIATVTSGLPGGEVTPSLTEPSRAARGSRRPARIVARIHAVHQPRARTRDVRRSVDDPELPVPPRGRLPERLSQRLPGRLARALARLTDDRSAARQLDLLRYPMAGREERGESLDERHATRRGDALDHSQPSLEVGDEPLAINRLSRIR